MAASAYHTRFVSLLCQSHCILTHICVVRAWVQDPTSVASGLAYIDALHATLGDLPEAQAALSSAASSSNDSLLYAFLRLADAHRSFQETIVELKQDVTKALAAIRRHNGTLLASALKSQRKS